MNIQQLEYILAVDTYRHFAKAAEHCRVTQPTLSMMIQKLEDELGVKLFDRNIQPVCPTPAGRKVIDQARVVLYQTSLIKDIVNEEEQSLKGTFRLAVLPTIAPYLLPRFFQQVSEKHPDQLMRFCQMEKVKLRPAAYRLGSLETFMRMVESGNGVTFMPELATYQLSEQQKELVRPFAIPKPAREIVWVTRKDFIRHSVAGILIESIRKSVPKEMRTLQAGL